MSLTESIEDVGRCSIQSNYSNFYANMPRFTPLLIVSLLPAFAFAQVTYDFRVHSKGVRAISAPPPTPPAQPPAPQLSPVSFSTTEKAPAVVLTNDNLTVAVASSYAGWAGVKGSAYASSGKWYWEVTAPSLNTSMILGVASETASPNGYPGLTANGWGYRPQNGWGTSNVNGTTATLSGTTVLERTTPFTVGMALDLDSGTLTISQGATVYAHFTNVSGSVTPMVSLDGSWGAISYQSATLNAGQSSFTYTLPTGYTAGFKTPK
jgi:hypothetical protein